MKSKALTTEVKYFTAWATTEHDRRLAIAIAEPFREDVNKPSWAVVVNTSSEHLDTLPKSGDPRIQIAARDQDLAIRLVGLFKKYDLIDEMVGLDADRNPEYAVRVTIYPKVTKN